MVERTLHTSVQEYLRVEIWQWLRDGKMIETAAEHLGIGTRQVRRLKKRIAEEGAVASSTDCETAPSNRKTEAAVENPVRS